MAIFIENCFFFIHVKCLYCVLYFCQINVYYYYYYYIIYMRPCPLQTYSMDCYFRQTWVDKRLAFSDMEEAFTLSVSMLDKLWKPDTYIHNGKNSHLHVITTPNKFIRLYQTGRILYSSR